MGTARDLPRSVLFDTIDRHVRRRVFQEFNQYQVQNWTKVWSGGEVVKQVGVFDPETNELPERGYFQSVQDLVVELLRVLDTGPEADKLRELGEQYQEIRRHRLEPHYTDSEISIILHEANIDARPRVWEEFHHVYDCCDCTGVDEVQQIAQDQWDEIIETIDREHQDHLAKLKAKVAEESAEEVREEMANIVRGMVTVAATPGIGLSEIRQGKFYTQFLREANFDKIYLN